MLCQKCRKRSAQFHSSRIINNQLVDIHLCKRCIENNGNQEHTNNIDGLLEVLVKTNVYDKNKADELKCNICGTTFSELQKNGLAGCPKCYSIFSDYLSEDRGRSYKRTGRTQQGIAIIEHLEKRLKKAVESEDFEEAAQLRDKIKDLEEGFSGDN
ncbi:MAG: UvrB/UvrC motif-containing protein [Spirochaetota bacterium]|nr:MAG: UvrB/UvrC motif-containing protein [Spirochaetota bacterium]